MKTVFSPLHLLYKPSHLPTGSILLVPSLCGFPSHLWEPGVADTEAKVTEESLAIELEARG